MEEGGGGCGCVFYLILYSMFQCVSMFYALATLFPLNGHANKVYAVCECVCVCVCVCVREQEIVSTCNVQFSLLLRNSTNRSTTPEVAMTSSMGGLGSN